MSNIFKKADIKAGYLLRVKDTNEDREFNMTVMPTSAYTPGPIGVLIGNIPTKAGDLAVCNPGTDWWPLDEFNDELAGQGRQVQAVYGYTTPKLLLDNSTEGRELLWERETVETPAEPVKMTMAEIAEKLGHPVEIVEG